ncbi:SDR family NAD(P)-dependent oxidoreductase [Humidisolicoccus flavus]|uniref:SDR family NAD(P)-dependent oxidoreductase n=1 Tax=Humidisolicoccus flavus TaxID=3111414 RepID=UPI00324B0CA7
MTKRILVTGASSGIGHACVRAAVDRGWSVLATARRADRLEALQAATGCEVFAADLTNQEHVEALAERAREFGITSLVNVAGGALGADSVEAGSLDEWQQMFDINVLATKRVVAATLPVLRDAVRDGGYADIVTVTSIAATVPYAGGAGYNAAKAAEHALSEVLRLELSGEPIRVMEIAPGMVHTEEFSLVRFHGDQEKADAVYKDVQDPLSAEDVAEVVSTVLALPGHISIDQLIVKPVAQTHPWMVHRGPLVPKPSA